MTMQCAGRAPHAPVEVDSPTLISMTSSVIISGKVAYLEELVEVCTFVPVFV
jgi:hypothetical protein